MSETISYETALNRIIAYYKPRRWSSKLMSRDAKASCRAAEDWLSRRRQPTGESLWNMLQSNPELRALLEKATDEAEAVCR